MQVAEKQQTKTDCKYKKSASIPILSNLVNAMDKKEKTDIPEYQPGYQ